MSYQRYTRCGHCTGKGVCSKVRRKLFSIQKWSCDSCLKSEGYQDKDIFHVVNCNVCNGTGKLTPEMLNPNGKKNEE